MYDVVDYAGMWIRTSDRREITCKIITPSTINCILNTNIQDKEDTYIVNGPELNWSHNTSYKGTYNGIDTITWSAGNNWIKHGKTYNSNVDENIIQLNI